MLAAVTTADGSTVAFEVGVALDTPTEVESYRYGGILNSVLRDSLNAEMGAPAEAGPPDPAGAPPRGSGVARTFGG